MVGLIRLRAVEPTDIPCLLAWENDRDIWMISDRHEAVSRHQLEQYIEQSLSQDIYALRQFRWMIDFREEGVWETVGTIDFYDFNPRHRRAGVGIYIAEAYRRKGIATESLQDLILYSKAHLSLHQLWAIIPEGHTASRALFESCGFKQSGLHLDWLLDAGSCHNVCIYQHIITY